MTRNFIIIKLVQLLEANFNYSKNDFFCFVLMLFPGLVAGDQICKVFVSSFTLPSLFPKALYNMSMKNPIQLKNWTGFFFPFVYINYFIDGQYIWNFKMCVQSQNGCHKKMLIYKMAVTIMV